jgi:hypothetical protein
MLNMQIFVYETGGSALIWRQLRRSVQRFVP